MLGHFREVFKRVCRIPSGPAGGQFTSCGTGGGGGSGSGFVSLASQTQPLSGGGGGGGGAGGGSLGTIGGITFPSFAGGSTGNPQKYNRALGSLASIMTNPALTPGQKAAAINAISGPSASHNYGKKFNALRAQALGILAHQTPANPPPSAPTGPFNKQPHRQQWNQNLVARLQAAASGPNAAAALASISLSKHAHVSVHAYRDALLKHYGQGGQAPPPVAPPPPTKAPTPPSPGTAAVTGAVGGINAGGRLVTTLPAAPAADATKYSAQDVALFQSKVKALQDAATSKNPETALNAITVYAPDLVKYKDDLLKHTKREWEASPAGKAHVANMKAAAAAIAAAKGNWDKQSDVEFSHYKKAKGDIDTDDSFLDDLIEHSRQAGDDTQRLGDRVLGHGHSQRRGRVNVSVMLDAQGFSGKPRNASTAAEFDSLVGVTGAHVLKRGVGDASSSHKATDMIDSFRKGDLFTSGSASAFGDGTYTHVESTKSSNNALVRGRGSPEYEISSDGHARDYAQSGSNSRGGIFEMALHPKAKIGDYTTLDDEFNRWSTKMYHLQRNLSATPAQRERAKHLSGIINNVGIYAAARGYDGFFAQRYAGMSGKSYHSYFVLLNRTAVITHPDTKAV